MAESETKLTRLERRFYKRHREEPRIYRMFDGYAQELIAAGVKRYSADGIFHRIRFQDAVEGKPAVKISNDLVSYYSRHWLVKHPEHVGFFATRNLKEWSAPERVLTTHHQP